VNWLDGVIIAVILFFTITAFQAGFIRETVTLISAVIGVVIAGLFYEQLADDVLLFIDSDAAARIISFGILFFAVALAGQMLALFLKPTTVMVQLGIFDQLAGAGLGFLKATVFVQIFLIVFVTYPKWGMGNAIDDSFIGGLMVDDGAVLVQVLPEEFEIAADNFKSGIRITPEESIPEN
jgi:membrane protein required for colicin V production